MNLKSFLIVTSILAITGASALADVNIKKISSARASTNCSSPGVQLPTIRELAVESQARGSKGILELNQVDPNDIPTGYYKISSKNSDNKKDIFYFSHEGFKRPDVPFGNNWFRSSSRVFSVDDVGGYYLSGFDGSLGVLRGAYDFTVNRCVTDPIENNIVLPEVIKASLPIEELVPYFSETADANVVEGIPEKCAIFPTRNVSFGCKRIAPYLSADGKTKVLGWRSWSYSAKSPHLMYLKIFKRQHDYSWKPTADYEIDLGDIDPRKIRYHNHIYLSDDQSRVSFLGASVSDSYVKNASKFLVDLNTLKIKSIPIGATSLDKNFKSYYVHYYITYPTGHPSKDQYTFFYEDSNGVTQSLTKVVERSTLLDSKYFVTFGFFLNSVKVLDVHSGKETIFENFDDIEFDSHPIERFFRTSSDNIAYINKDGLIRIFDPRTGKKVGDIKLDQLAREFLTEKFFEGFHKIIVVGDHVQLSNLDKLVVVNYKTGKTALNFKGPLESNRFGEVSRDLNYIIYCGGNQSYFDDRCYLEKISDGKIILNVLFYKSAIDSEYYDLKFIDSTSREISLVRRDQYYFGLAPVIFAFAW